MGEPGVEATLTSHPQMHLVEKLAKDELLPSPSCGLNLPYFITKIIGYRLRLNASNSYHSYNFFDDVFYFFVEMNFSPDIQT